MDLGDVSTEYGCAAEHPEHVLPIEKADMQDSVRKCESGHGVQTT